MQKLRSVLLLIIIICWQQAIGQCPATLTLTVASVTPANCPDNGIVTLGGSGVANPAVTFKIVSGPSQTGAIQSNNIFSSLSAGTYVFEAKCLSQTVQVSATVTNGYTAMNPNFTVSVTGVCTAYTKGGTITVTGISGGRAPIQYSFIKNSQANYNDALSAYGASSSFSATDTGVYQVRIKDACGVFITKSINIQPFYNPANFAGASVDLDNVACDSAGIWFWMGNDDWEGTELRDYSKLRFSIYEKGVGCTKGMLIKTVELLGTDNTYLVIPRRDVYIEITTPCGDVRGNCYDYPDDDRLDSKWLPLVSGCGSVASPYTFSIKHQYNLFCKTPFNVKLYNNSTNALISNKNYSDNWNCDTYSSLPFAQYRLEITDACGKKDTVIVDAPSGAVGVIPVDAGTTVDQDCSFHNGKTTVKLKLTGLISNFDVSTLTITSGPDNIGQTATANEDALFYFFEMTPGATYSFQLSNGCTFTTVSFTVPTDTWRTIQFSMSPAVTQQCGGSGTIHSNVSYNGWGSYKTQLYSGSTLVSENNSGDYTNVAPGLYTVKAISEQTWCSGPTSFTLNDTVRVYNDGTPPQLLRQFGYVCETGPSSTGKVNIVVAGFGPFKYEIKQVSPVAASAYTLIASNNMGNYTIDNLDPNAVYNLLITDNCGKSTVSQIVVGNIGNLNFDNPYNPCVGSPYLLSAPLIAGATYIWKRESDNTVYSTTRDLYFGNYDSWYDGDYTCTILIAGSCLSKDMKVSLTSGLCGAFLPVKMTSIGIQHKDCSAQLSWSTASLLNGQFEIQQSRDGNNFVTVGQVNPSNASFSRSNQYSFITPELAAGRTWFRIAMVEANGQKSYSTILPVENSCKVSGMKISLYPNPVAGDHLNAKIQTRDNAIVSIQILNSYGAVLSSHQVLPTDGQSDWNVPVKNLPKGVYFLKASGGSGFNETIKFVKL